MKPGGTTEHGARAAAALTADPARVSAARRVSPSADTSAALDRVAGLAARLLGVSCAQVSLLSDVQLVAGGYGLPPGAGGSTGPLQDSLCTLTAAAGAPVAIQDTRVEERSRYLPPVVSGLASSYLGVPLYGESGLITGSLCVFDPAVREWSPSDVESLELLGRAVSTELELASLTSEYRSDQLRWGAAAEAGGVGSFDWNLPDGPLLWDERLIEMFGYDGDDTFGHSIADFTARLHPDDVDRVGAALAAAIESRGPFESEYRIVLPTGDVRWVQARGQTITDRAGEPSHLIGAAYDTTDVHDGQVRTARVLEAMPSGFLSMDTEWRFTVLNSAAEELVGSSRTELLGRTLWEAFPATVGTEFERTYRATVASGEARTLEAYYPAPLDAWFDILCWPTPDGLSLFFSNITDRKKAAARASATSARLAALAAVNADLVETADVSATISAIPRRLVPALGVACVITRVDDSGRPREVGSWHVDPAQRPVLAATFAALGDLRSSTVAIRARGKVLGTLTLYALTAEPVDADVEATVQTIADRIGLALDNARLAKARAQLAEGLQRSLLTEPPQPDHGQIVVRYQPAAEAAQVGGDWYDAFVQPGGTTMLVIGDVVGHDTAAAAAMAQLRGLLRGIATYSDAGPAEVLRGLDAAMHVLELNTLATAAIARFEQTPAEFERGVTRMVWANAGHPPPLIVNPDGSFAVLAGGKGDLLLGVDPGAVRVEQAVTLDPGSTVLLYTDGLIERRTADLDDGLARLTQAVTDLDDAPLDGLCDGVIERLVDGTPDDDIAIVAIRLHPQDGPRAPVAGDVPPGIPEPAYAAR